MPSPSSFSPKFSFAIAFSFSLALSSSSHSPLPFLPKFPTNLSLELFSSHSSASRHSSPSPSQSIAADILSLLGSKHDAGRIPRDEARQIRSCLRFLVPPASDSLKGRRKISEKLIRTKLDEENEMVWWPPAPVMELARLAVDSGGDPGTIQRSLDPTKLLVPDVEDLKKDKCELTRTPNGYRFANKDLNSYFEFLFELIVERAPSVGMNVSLNRYDLFHGHLFLASDSGRLGFMPESIQHMKGKGSTVIYDDSMNLRNILWLAPLPSNVTKAWLAPGTLVVLDAHPGGVIYEKLVPDYVDFVRTIYEDDFGDVVVDVNYMNLDNVAPGERIFIC
ncbi:hypothetical protein MA16_Dca014287 [Dendrobium catenatum]|uniref:Uncharacterized protein n=1 Tax=Dendrobium catenatum TaxID=906689 RepID=A0A2I0VJZ4_9ASPA|nr:hypothetical protein MA16_Dca014287 [Dendrobium catenatum]